jgi:transposase
MYDGFINAAKEVFGSKTNIIIDRFHVAKNYRGAIEKLRKKELKRLKKELTENDYKKLKNIMWILRRKKSDLSESDKETLNFFFKYSVLMKKAYKFRNKLTDIFNQNLSKKQAIRKIKRWIKSIEESGLTCFDTFIKTLRKLWHDILNYFTDRLNSGFVEGLNNRIKVIKRRCYGIFNTKNLFQRISIDLKGYSINN